MSPLAQALARYAVLVAFAVALGVALTLVGR